MFIAQVNARVSEVHRPKWAEGQGVLGGLLRIECSCCDLISANKFLNLPFFGY